MRPDHQLCRLSLALLEAVAPLRRVELPRLEVVSSRRSSAFGSYCVVSEWEHPSHVVWEGHACCKWQARIRAVRRLLGLRDPDRRSPCRRCHGTGKEVS